MTDEELEALRGHTPGPWERCCHGEWVSFDGREDMPREVYSIPLESGPSIAYVFGEEKVRDALLMAAAPQLLAELIEARRLLRESISRAEAWDCGMRDRIRAFLDGEAKK